MSHQTILVLDFGSQFTQLIARRLRELSVYSEILPFNTPIETIRAQGSRSASSSRADRRACPSTDAPKCDPRVLELGLPTLGICYGMQLMTDMLGGQVAPSPHREFGFAAVNVAAGCAPRLFRTLPADLRVWASHGDFVAAAPPGFAVVATSANAPVAAMEAPERGYYALLFHPEVAHTERGSEILQNFAFDVCGCRGDWTIASFIDEAIGRIRQQVGEGRVVCALSGGVDSTVAATLIHRAIGDRLQCIFVDNGVLRLNEAAQVVERYKKLRLPVHFVDASDAFLSRLAGVVDPEQKRKIIGATFIDVFEEEARGARRLRLPRAGHAVSGCDRVGLGARTVGDDQEPSQRRRPARAHALHAGRAAAGAVQGRSPRRRPRPGHRSRVPDPAAVSRSRVSPFGCSGH